MAHDRELARGRRSDEGAARPRRRAENPVLALQRAAGNRAVGQMLLARQPSTSKQGSTVKIGKFTIEVTGGNLGEWAAAGKGEAPDKVVVTSEKGRHSAELARLAKDHTKIKTLTLTVPSANKSSQLDLGSVEITLDNAVIKGYSLDGKTESWQIVDYDGVHKKTITHNIGQH